MNLQLQYCIRIDFMWSQVWGDLHARKLSRTEESQQNRTETLHIRGWEQEVPILGGCNRFLLVLACESVQYSMYNNALYSDRVSSVQYIHMGEISPAEVVPLRPLTPRFSFVCGPACHFMWFECSLTHHEPIEHKDSR
jgi:hypothetical protein